jgi:hypothetical protein
MISQQMKTQGAQIVGSASSWSQLQDRMFKSNRKWLKNNYKCVFQQDVSYFYEVLSKKLSYI